MALKAFSKTMQRCVAGMRQHNGMIDRHPGGFWKCGGPVFGTSTIEALVARGVAEYCEWKDGRSGRFPIRAKLTESEKRDDGQ